MAFSNSTSYIGDGDAVLVGMPRLRQLRVKNGTNQDSVVRIYISFEKVIRCLCFRATQQI